MRINEIAARINQINHDKGFYDRGERNFGEVIALMHSELSEALEEHRNGVAIGDVYYVGSKPEGVAIELVDCLIRILDTLHEHGVNIEELVQIKVDYNEGRERHHGKARGY